MEATEAERSPQERPTLTRKRAKCSECRAQKISCQPPDRDWNKHQRCDYCFSHDLSCGPKYKKSEDPAIRTNGSDVGDLVPQSALVGAQRPEAEASTVLAASSASRHGDSNQAHVLNVSQTDNIRDGIKESRGNLQELHALCKAFEFRRQYSYSPIFESMKIKDRIHLVFINIYRFILRLDSQGEDDWTRSVLYPLYAALLNYQCLRDDQKRVPLSKMANIFKKLGCCFECEKMLELLSSVPSCHPNEEICFSMASSFLHTSNLIHDALADNWRKTTGEENLPPDFGFPCLHRAAQFQNGGVTSAVLNSQHPLVPTPGTHNERYLSVSNFLQTAHGSNQSIQARVGVDLRDAYQQTALFVAAARGSEKACFALITALADPNARDGTNRTVLEVAARTGNFEVVILLLAVGAVVNPQLFYGTSSPLQAAIESENYNFKLVKHLLDVEADVNVRRFPDNKNAMDIAKEKERSDLVLILGGQP